MRSSGLFLSFSLGSLFFAAPGLAGVHLFEVGDVPVSGQVCMQEAQALADRLVAVAQVKADRVYCTTGTNEKSTLSVVYEAEKALVAVDSINHNDIDVSIGQGIYRTLDDCQSDLEKQKTEFATMTGSTVVVTYCTKQPFYSTHAYYPLLVGLVKDPKAYSELMFKTYPIFGRAPADADSVAQAFSDHLRAAGVAVRKVVFADEPADSRLQVSYYGATPIPFLVKQKVAFETYEVCQSQSDTLLAAFAKAAVGVYGSFCSWDEYSNSAKFFVINRKSERDIVWTLVPGAYPSRETCAADQMHMETVYRSQGLDIAGSVCIFDSGFKLALLSGT